MIELALEYARNGWHVFPLAPNSKVPTAGSRGFKDATTDPARIEEMWRDPYFNVGLATGRISGLFVLDVDTKDGRPGLESARLLNLPRTLTVRTPTGGFHAYFSLPFGAKCASGKDMLPGIDWRCDGGYVVAAGSVTPKGTYLIARQAPIATLPQHLLLRAANWAKEYRVRRDADSGDMVLPQGSRDSDLYRIGCALRNFGVNEAAIYAALDAVNSQHCRPPMERHDLERIAHSCMRHEPKHRAAD